MGSSKFRADSILRSSTGLGPSSERCRRGPESAPECPPGSRSGSLTAGNLADTGFKSVAEAISEPAPTGLATEVKPGTPTIGSMDPRTVL
jgi:hypothetical protein